MTERQPEVATEEGGDVRNDGNDVRCTHLGGGVCQTHGPGARRRWRPVSRTTTLPGGGVRRIVERLYFYECDLVPNRRGGVMTAGRQRLLSFAAQQADARRGDHDNTSGVSLNSTSGRDAAR